MKIQLYIYLTILSVLINSTLFSQSIIRQSINSWGGTGYDNGYYLKQTAGQSSNTTIINGDKKIVRQGFQQPQNGLSISATCNSCNISLFPNPLITKSVLKISLNTKSYDIRIYDLFGRPVWIRQKITSEEITLNAVDFKSNAYIIIVIYNDGSICTIKLIVTNE